MPSHLMPSTDRTLLPPWGEREIGRFQFRVALFTRRGMPEAEAETLADRLFERDYERDDRRMCIECAHLRRNYVCAKRQPALADVLMRCHLFTWETPKQ